MLAESPRRRLRGKKNHIQPERLVIGIFVFMDFPSHLPPNIYTGLPEDSVDLPGHDFERMRKKSISVEPDETQLQPSSSLAFRSTVVREGFSFPGIGFHKRMDKRTGDEYCKHAKTCRKSLRYGSHGILPNKEASKTMRFVGGKRMSFRGV
jgi:hypothetical protein